MNLETESKIDLSRDAKQKHLINQWEKKGCKGTIVAPTGLGKTRMVIEYVLKHSKKKLVIVHKLDLLQQWKSRCSDCEVMSVQSIIRKKDFEHYDVIVYDEVHKLIGNKFKKCFNIPSDKKICLTATADKKVRTFLSLINLPVVAECTYEEATNNGWISDYVEYNIPVYLDEEDSSYLKKLQDEYDKKMRFICLDNPEWSIVEKILERKAINSDKGKKTYKYENAEVVAKVRKVPIGVVIGAAIKLRKIIQERKKVIYNHPKKIEYVKKLFELYNGKKIITFSMENSFADEISKKAGGVSLHGGIKPKKLQDEILDKFNKGEIMILNTCNKLNEGTDIKELEIGINMSYFSTINVNKQRLGRIIRKEDKEPIFINLYCKYHPKFPGFSQEEFWLRKQQKDRQSKIVWLTSIRDLYAEKNNEL